MPCQTRVGDSPFQNCCCSGEGRSKLEATTTRPGRYSTLGRSLGTNALRILIVAKSDEILVYEVTIYSDVSPQPLVAIIQKH